MWVTLVPVNCFNISKWNWSAGVEPERRMKPEHELWNLTFGWARPARPGRTQTSVSGISKWWCRKHYFVVLGAIGTRGWGPAPQRAALARAGLRVWGWAPRACALQTAVPAPSLRARGCQTHAGSCSQTTSQLSVFSLTQSRWQGQRQRRARRQRGREGPGGEPRGAPGQGRCSQGVRPQGQTDRPRAGSSGLIPPHSPLLLLPPFAAFSLRSSLSLTIQLHGSLPAALLEDQKKKKEYE